MANTTEVVELTMDNDSEETGSGRSLAHFPEVGGGYQRKSHLPTEIFNITGALVLILLTLPFFVVVYVLLLIREGRPVFYRGERLGKDKRIFHMYKFRTLVTDAEKQLRGELLGSRRELVTPTGKFLRDTRLDELPQLWNVLWRDMDLVGPRPERPEVYEAKCKSIPYYDRRFLVRPGLVGFSQIFTPHSAPKEIRSLIDNRLLRKQESVIWNIKVLSTTGFLILKAIWQKGSVLLRDKLVNQLLLRRYNEKRKYDRFDATHAVCALQAATDPTRLIPMDEMVDINVEAFLLRTKVDIEGSLPAMFQLKVKVRKTGQSHWKTKKAWCRGELYRKREVGEGVYEFVVKYKPASPLNSYIIHQYFLHESMG